MAHRQKAGQKERKVIEIDENLLYADITVVIPTYNRPGVLKDTIESYLAGRVLPRQILIVDQTPKPFDPATVPNNKGVELGVLQSTTPSLTLARNIGARASSYDTILFSDDDILVDEESVAVLAEAMADEAIALVAGVDIAENGVHASPSKPGLARDVMGMLLGMKKPWRRDGYVVRASMRGRYPMPVSERVPTEWAMGYFFCVRRSLMERWDVWFDEGMQRYAYAEDLDFSMRYCACACADGYECVLEPRIYVHHLASTEWRTPSDEAVRYFVDNRRRIARKVYPGRWWYYLTMGWLDTLFALIKLPSDAGYAKCLLRNVYGRRVESGAPEQKGMANKEDDPEGSAG